MSWAVRLVLLIVAVDYDTVTGPRIADVHPARESAGAEHAEAQDVPIPEQIPGLSGFFLQHLSQRRRSRLPAGAQRRAASAPCPQGNV